MSNLDPRIEAVRDQYGLANSDFWQIPQNKQWVCKHAALEIVATKANVIWSPPQIIQADTANGIAVLSVIGKLGERTEWATGEASPKNNKNSYPWAMAEKRAKDRVVLKLVGIHGLVYSEDEMPNEQDGRGFPARIEDGRSKPSGAPAPKTASSAEQKRGLADIEKELLDCNSLIAVGKCADGWKFIAKRDGWSKDFMQEAANRFQRRRAELETHNDNADVFPGDRPSTIRDLPEQAQNLAAG